MKWNSQPVPQAGAELPVVEGRPRAADGTPLSQSPACGSADERARARARVEGAGERRYWCKASSMASERECWPRGTSISSKHCQSG